MYVVVKVDPGQAMVDLMTMLANCAMTFSVTDDLHKICSAEAKKNSKEVSAQTSRAGSSSPLPLPSHPPQSKKRKTGSDSSKTSTASATSSSNASSGNATAATTSWKKVGSFPIPPSAASPILQSMAEMTGDADSPNSKTEEDFPSMDVTEEQNQLIMSLFRNDLLKCELEDSAEDFEDTRAFDDGKTGSSQPGVAFDPEAFGKQFSIFADASAMLNTSGQHKQKKRGICQMCNREVSVISTHKRRHAITHLGIKTLRCQLCNKYFSRPDLANPHFKRDHPNSVPIAFVDTISETDAAKIREMMTTCFPPSANGAVEEEDDST